MAIRSYTRMVGKGKDSALNIIIARVQERNYEDPEYHLVSVDWPNESKNWNAKEKEKSLKDIHQLVKKIRKIDLRMYCWSEYFADGLDMENTIGKIFERVEKESIEVLGISPNFWNKMKPKIELTDMRARLQALSPQMVDESGEVYAVEWDSFEPNGKMLNWLANMKMKVKKREVDRLKPQIHGTDNHLVIWAKNRK